MRIALIQQHASRDKAENLSRGLAALREAAQSGAKLACFAELAFEWFHPQFPAEPNFADLAEPMNGPIVTSLRAAAKELGIVVVANLFERDGNECYDTSPVIDADGVLRGNTRMMHITDYPCFHEQGYYTPGDTGAPVFETAIGRIGVAICYDRHFPEYMRQLALAGADLVIIPQAGAVDEWPDGLYEAEMQTAAFQSGYWIALCNRVGREDGLMFAGESFVTSPSGCVTTRAPRGEDHILFADVDFAACANSHARQLFLRHRRPDVYREWTT